MSKNIYDYKHVKSVSAIGLLKNGKPAGKIICNWSDNPMGSVCTAQVILYDGIISEKIKTRHIKTKFLDCHLAVVMLGKASGYGYDKKSSAIASALRVGGIEDIIKVEGGSGNERQAFEDAGFEWFEVC